MQDVFYLLGLLTGVAFRFFYDQVRRHQRRKRRLLQHRQSIRDRYF